MDYLLYRRITHDITILNHSHQCMLKFAISDKGGIASILRCNHDQFCVCVCVCVCVFQFS